MKIALCGATGRAGSRILQELVLRGHQVIAIVKNAGSLPTRERVVVLTDDLADEEHTAESIKGADAFVSAYAPPPADVTELVRVTGRLVRATELSGVPRFLMVGGAGSLQVAPGLTLEHSGKLPPEWRSIARAHTLALETLRSSTIDWTSFCPAAYFDPGERTGHFRLGTDNLIVNEHGVSRISMEDYAIALVDELENPRHERMRFSIGY